MYRPPLFREDRTEVLAAFAAAHPFATLIAAAEGGLTANHLPMLVEPSGDAVRLRGHIARGNDLWRRVAADAPVLAVFQGADHYVTPSWYPSKQQTGEVVPTWNYSVVHAHGTIRFFDDAPALRTLVTQLTDLHEGTRSSPWAVSDAPTPYIDGMLKAIVGFDVTVTRLEGKFKASQNRNPADRAGVSTGLTADGVGPAERAELVRDPG